ncbi:MAG: LamG-like jellyroll fold domain-containing protein [Patescibacteria group bacterium]|nr:LamG-like jellyroll fold domain-containing protein [Patescibacteria group bacterium]
MCARALLTLVMTTVGCLCATVSADTIGYWRFEGADDATGFLLDSSGNGHALVRSALPGVSQIPLPAVGTGSAFANPVLQTGAANSSAGSFTTANGFLSAAYDSSYLVDAFTIEAFINPSALSANTVAVGQFSTTTGDPQRRWFLGATTGSQLRVALASTPGSAPVLDTNAVNWVGPSGMVPTSLMVGNDYYVAASVSLATGGAGTGLVTFYLQNLTEGGPLLTQTLTHSVATLHPSTAYLAIGAMASGGNQFPGLVDEVRFSSGVLSPNQLLIVPEPGSWLLLAVGGLMLAVSRRRQHGGDEPNGLVERQ